ncbi:MAG: endolytic transglycosylase MltG [Nitrospinota bacterium]
MSEDGPISPETHEPETSSANSPPPSRRRWFKPVLAFALLTATGAWAGYAFLERNFDRPTAPSRTGKILFRVKAGMGLGKISRELARAGLIRRPRIFQLQVRLRGGAHRIFVGTYRLSPSMPPRRIYRIIIEGRVAERSITIPEGFNLKEIAALIEKAGFGKRSEVLRLARDPAFLSNLHIREDSLEGYLFPDTYRFPLDTPPRRILAKLVRTLRQKFGPELAKRASEVNLSLHETLTLASVIEKETSLDAERPLVAAVFVNRLRRKMRLQSDPTVIYALPHYDGNIRREDLAYDSRYNTYRYKGLPPGPIASPGFASIRAALYPAQVDYLYFVANLKGGHQFSRTYREHRKAVWRFQKRKRAVDR